MTSQPHACALLTLLPNEGDGWPAVAVPILRWLAQCEPGLLPEFRMQLLLETFSTDLADGPTTIVIERLTEGADTISEWAVRYCAPDRGLASRIWQTDIGLVRDGGRWQVSALLSHSLAPGYFGVDAELPAPAPPAIVAPLLASKRWSVAPVGGFAHGEGFHLLHPGAGATLVAAIADGARTRPLVYVSQSPHGGPMCDPQLLARALCGTAPTVVAAAPGLDQELDRLIPQGFHCFGGAIRIYLPEVRFDDPRDAVRHRYLPPQDLALMEPDAVAQSVCRGILSWTLARQTGILTLDDLRAHALQQRLLALRAAADRDEHELKSYAALLEQENEQLTAQVQLLKTQLQQTTEEIARLESESARKVRRLMGDLDRARQSGGQAPLLGPPDLDALRELPEDLPAMLETVCKLFPTRLRATDRARKSASEASINRPRDVRAAWRALYALATTMYELVFSEGAAGNIPKRFSDLTGIECAMTEGHQTKRDERMMALRRDTDDLGNPIDITPHIKFGDRPPHLLRVHFAIDHPRRLLIIGHCGDHLDTFGTQWVR